MSGQEDQLRTTLMENILEYLEGNGTYKEIITIGTHAYKTSMPLVPALSDVVRQLHVMDDKISKGEDYSREYIQETFTSMLEKLTNDTTGIQV